MRDFLQYLYTPARCLAAFFAMVDVVGMLWFFSSIADVWTLGVALGLVVGSVTPDKWLRNPAIRTMFLLLVSVGLAQNVFFIFDHIEAVQNQEPWAILVVPGTFDDFIFLRGVTTVLFLLLITRPFVANSPRRT